MAEIVNLRRARKAKARDATAKAADANRAAFGRTMAERGASASEQERLQRDLDGTRIER